jgi:hypothetical protein
MDLRRSDAAAELDTDSTPDGETPPPRHRPRIDGIDLFDDRSAPSLAQRIAGLTWTGGAPGREKSQIRHMREFLRRSALFIREAADNRPEIENPEIGLWPFADLAGLVNPDIRASGATLEKARGSLRGMNFHSSMTRSVDHMLHFRALIESGHPLPEYGDPFAPLLTLFEHGDFFSALPNGRIEVGTEEIRRGHMGDYLERGSFIGNDPVP